MLDKTNPSDRSLTRPEIAVHPRVGTIETAVPKHVLHQSEIIQAVRELCSTTGADFAKFQPIFDNAEVDTRHTCRPLEWFNETHSFPERNKIYVEDALDLLADVARRAIEPSGFSAQDIDGLVVVSSTGFATPSLDSYLIERLGLRPDVLRTPVFGLGCAAGVTGLGRAAQMAAAAPGSIYLFLAVELCSLTFQIDDMALSNIVATAIFGDGAAGCLVGTAVDGPKIEGWGEHTWPSTDDVLGWELRDNGFGVVLSQNIPFIVQRKVKRVAEKYLAGYGLDLDDIQSFVCHPGGAKVLDALEEIYGRKNGSLVAERRVLRRYGNMSAPTALFILRDTLAASPPPGNMLLTAMGPGFTASFAHLEIE